MTASPLAQKATDAFNAPICETDPEIAELLDSELGRQRSGLEMIASENFVPRAVLQCQGSVLTNKYAEGYPGRRYYGGCEYVDQVETIACERAKALFGAEYANVQPHSGAQANAAVYQALVKPGDTVLGLALDHGGHLTHGMKINFSGRFYHAEAYGVNPETFRIDPEIIRQRALETHPAMIIGGGIATSPFLNPGVSHNAFIAKMAGMDVMQLIAFSAPRTVGLGILAIILMTVVCVVYKDYNKNQTEEEMEANLALGGTAGNASLPEHPNVLKAIASLLPVVILVVASIWFKDLKVSVGTAMLLGTIYVFLVTRANPAEISKKFFDGMGEGYAKIMGIIIAAGVFASGLTAAGVVGDLVEFLKHAQSVAKLGGSVGPFLLGLITGSGDAAAFAFNEAVTPHAAEFGMSIPSLGVLAAFAGAFGRQASPLCGGLILVAGIAGVNPMDIVRRTAPVMVILLVCLYIVS